MGRAHGLYCSRYSDHIATVLEAGTGNIADAAGLAAALEYISRLGIANIGHEPVAVGHALNEEGIAVRAGHHCAEPILHRFGVTATVRPSLAFYNTCEEVDALAAALLRLATRPGRK